MHELGTVWSDAGIRGLKGRFRLKDVLEFEWSDPVEEAMIRRCRSYVSTRMEDVEHGARHELPRMRTAIMEFNGASSICRALPCGSFGSRADTMKIKSVPEVGGKLHGLRKSEQNACWMSLTCIQHTNS